MRAVPLAVALLAAAPAAARDLAARDPAPPAAPAPAAPASAPAPPRTLGLDEALRIGLSRQPQLRQAQANVDAARARVDQAFAPLLPQVTGTASWDHGASETNRAALGLGTGTVTTARTEYGLDLTGRLLLWDFGKTSGRWSAARAVAAGQTESERATRTAVALNVRTAYFDAVAAKALVAVARESLANTGRHLEQVRAFVEIGTRPPIDLAQERTNVANARVQLIQAENGYATARVRVEQAIGASDLGAWEIADESLPPVPGEEGAPETLLAEALAARPELAALAQQLRGQELTVDALRGGYLPSVGLAAGASETGPRPDDLRYAWNTGVTLTWPLFEGGATRAQVREARATATAIDAQLEQLRQSVRLEVEQARLGVRAAGATLGAAGEAADAARERLTLAEGRYQTGVGSVLELADAQLALTTALGQRVQAEFQLAAARSQLLKALGRE
jgi:outer membrane protein